MKILRRICAALLSAGMLIAASGCQPVSLLPLPEPEPAARAFFEAYFSGDGAALSELTCSYDAVSLDWKGDGEYYDMMNSLLEESYGYTIDGAAEVSGMSAQLPVSVTVFDFRKLEESLTQTTTDIALNSRKAGGTAYENEDEVMDLLCDALSQITAQPEEYYTTVSVDMELNYIDGQWLVVMDDELLRLLSGYAF